MSVDPDAAVYSIGVVQKLTGLSGRQIRYYDQQGLVRPKRTRGNRRLYSPADVERLRKIKELLDQGMNLAGIREWLKQWEDAGPDKAVATSPAKGREQQEATAAAGSPGGPNHPPPSPPGQADSPAGDTRRFDAFDDLRLTHELMQHPDLTSLYPVDHQAALLRLLQASSPRKDESTRE